MVSDDNLHELAIATWRLEKWLNKLETKRKLAAKSAIRTYKSFLTTSGVEIKDPIGTHFDPGLALEVISNEAEDSNEEDLVIIETISPYIYLNGELFSAAKVVIGLPERSSEQGSSAVIQEIPKTSREPEKKVKQKHRKKKAKEVALLRKKMNKKSKKGKK